MTESDPALSPAVDRYIEQLLVRPDAALGAANADAAAAGLPSIQVSAPQGAFLALLARAIGARRVLELGTLGGYSTIWLARALPPEGRLLTLELDPHHADVARKNLARAGVADRVEVRVGPALESLRQMSRDPLVPFDLVFLDAEKTEYADYLRAVLTVSRPGTVIVADNVVRGGAVADAGSSDPRVLGIRRFFEQIAATPELEGTVLQTVGTKGYDGMAILRVRDSDAPTRT